MVSKARMSCEYLMPSATVRFHDVPDSSLILGGGSGDDCQF